MFSQMVAASHKANYNFNEMKRRKKVKDSDDQLGVLQRQKEISWPNFHRHLVIPFSLFCASFKVLP